MCPLSGRTMKILLRTRRHGTQQEAVAMPEQRTRDGSKGPGYGAAVALPVAAAVVAAGLIYWQEQKQEKLMVENMKSVPADGPLIDIHNKMIQKNVRKATLMRSLSLLSSKDRHAISEAFQAESSMSHQVGGLASHKKPFLKASDHLVLKPMRADHRGVRATAFFEGLTLAGRSSTNLGAYIHFLATGQTKPDSLAGRIYQKMANLLFTSRVLTASEEELPSAAALVDEFELMKRLYEFIPRYYGTMDAPKEDSESDISPYLVLEDITAGFSKPCIIDIKMGTESYEPDAKPEKRKQEYEKYPKMSEYGFRIVGMRVYDDGEFRSYDKSYGVELETIEEITKAIRIFFGEADPDQKSTTSLNLDLVKKTMEQLQPITQWFDDNKLLSMYASSLLFIYEGDTSSENAGDVLIKMVDFGRVRRTKGGDQGYRVGLKTLNSILSSIV